MNLLLILFAIPFAIIVFSIIIQKIIDNPILVAFATFSAFLLVAASISNDNYYIYTIVYAIVSYVAAISTKIIESIKSRCIDNQEDTIDNATTNNTIDICDKSDIVIEKNKINRKYWR